MNVDLDGLIPLTLAFMLVTARLSGLFLLAPVLSSGQIPMRIKLMVLLVLGATMTPMLAVDLATLPTDTTAIMVLMLKEVLIGAAMGFAVSVVFTAVQVGASMIDTSAGLAMANVMDPLNNIQASVFGSFYSMVATLTFLAINGHHWMIEGFARSFEVVPVDGLPKFERMLYNTQEVFAQLFVMAFQIAAPVIVTLLLADVVLGITARVVPQMNVFFVGMPLKIGITMIAVIIAMPTFVNVFESRISDVVTGASVLAGAGTTTNTG